MGSIGAIFHTSCYESGFHRLIQFCDPGKMITGRLADGGVIVVGNFSAMRWMVSDFGTLSLYPRDN